MGGWHQFLIRFDRLTNLIPSRTSNKQYMVRSAVPCLANATWPWDWDMVVDCSDGTAAARQIQSWSLFDRTTFTHVTYLMISAGSWEVAMELETPAEEGEEVLHLRQGGLRPLLPQVPPSDQARKWGGLKRVRLRLHRCCHASMWGGTFRRRQNWLKINH